MRPNPDKPEPKTLILRNACPEPALNEVKDLATGAPRRQDKFASRRWQVANRAIQADSHLRLGACKRFFFSLQLSVLVRGVFLSSGPDGPLIRRQID